MLTFGPHERVLRTARAVATCAAIALLVGACGVARHTVYYLALGDSLSVGVQPTSSGDSVETDRGYVNAIYAHYKAQYPHLQLVQLGCPGDTTQSMISGQGNRAAVARYHCDLSGGSQLKAAAAFIAAHRGQVKLISVDIGTNDVVHCLSGSMFAEGLQATVGCIQAGKRTIAANTPTILDSLRRAAAPSTVLVGATLYDPFLSGALLAHTQYGAVASAVARASPGLLAEINTVIAASDSAAGFRTADVAEAFRTYDTTAVRSQRLGTQPADVGGLCALTWACTAAPQGPNIHPNDHGYRVIAKAYEDVLPPRL